jgi:hypothetical protein
VPAQQSILAKVGDLFSSVAGDVVRKNRLQRPPFNAKCCREAAQSRKRSMSDRTIFILIGTQSLRMWLEPNVTARSPRFREERGSDEVERCGSRSRRSREHRGPG